MPALLAAYPLTFIFFLLAASISFLSKMVGWTITAVSGMLDLKFSSPVNCELQIQLSSKKQKRAD